MQSHGKRNETKKEKKKYEIQHQTFFFSYTVGEKAYIIYTDTFDLHINTKKEKNMIHTCAFAN